MRRMRTFALLLLLLPLSLLAQGVLNLTGQAENAKPDILFLAPQLIDSPSAYTALSKASELGTTLPNVHLSAENFTSGGIVSTLAAAGYRILPIRDIPWENACEQLTQILDLRHRTRHEDNVEQPPICAILIEEVSAQTLDASLPTMLANDAFVIVAPQSPLLPTICCWRNVIWPNHVADAPVTPDHFISTLAEIAGLPVPAEVEEVSILPLLTACGYQRPIEALPVDSDSVTGTELRLYKDLPLNLPWVPDFQSLIPTERQFTKELPPLSEKAFSAMTCARRSETGIYLRTAITSADWTFAPGISCVIRIEGRPVFSTYLSTLARRWRFHTKKPVQIELFLLVPAGFKLESLPLWGSASPSAPAA